LAEVGVARPIDAEAGFSLSLSSNKQDWKLIACKASSLQF